MHEQKRTSHSLPHRLSRMPFSIQRSGKVFVFVRAKQTGKICSVPNNELIGWFAVHGSLPVSHALHSEASVTPCRRTSSEVTRPSEPRLESGQGFAKLAINKHLETTRPISSLRTNLWAEARNVVAPGQHREQQEGAGVQGGWPGVPVHTAMFRKSWGTHIRTQR